MEKNKSEFTNEYKNSMKIVQGEWDKNLVEELKTLSDKCNEVLNEFDKVDITIATTVNKGGSF